MATCEKARILRVCTLCCLLIVCGDLYAKPLTGGVFPSITGKWNEKLEPGVKSLVEKLPGLPEKPLRLLKRKIRPGGMLEFAKLVEEYAVLDASRSKWFAPVLHPLSLAPAKAAKGMRKGLKVLTGLLDKMPLKTSLLNTLFGRSALSAASYNHCARFPGLLVHVFKRRGLRSVVVRIDTGDGICLFGVSNRDPLTDELPAGRGANPAGLPVAFFDYSAGCYEYVHVATSGSAPLPTVLCGALLPSPGQNIALSLSMCDGKSMLVGAQVGLGMEFETSVPGQPFDGGVQGGMFVCFEGAPAVVGPLVDFVSRRAGKLYDKARKWKDRTPGDAEIAHVVSSLLNGLGSCDTPKGFEAPRFGIATMAGVEAGLAFWDCKASALASTSTETLWLPFSSLKKIARCVDADLIRAMRAFNASALLLVSDAGMIPGKVRKRRLSPTGRAALLKEAARDAAHVVSKLAKGIGGMVGESTLEISSAIEEGTSLSSGRNDDSGKIGAKVLDKASTSVPLFVTAVDIPLKNLAKAVKKGSIGAALFDALGTLRRLARVKFRAGRDRQAVSRLVGDLDELAHTVLDDAGFALRIAPVPGTFVAFKSRVGSLAWAFENATNGMLGLAEAMMAAARAKSVTAIAKELSPGGRLDRLMAQKNRQSRLFRKSTRIGLGMGGGLSGEIGAEAKIDLGVGTCASITSDLEFPMCLAGDKYDDSRLNGSVRLAFNVESSGAGGVSLGEAVELQAQLALSSGIDVLAIQVAEYDGPLPRRPGMDEIADGAAQVVDGASHMAHTAVKTCRQLCAELLAAGKSVRQTIIELKNTHKKSAAEIADAVRHCGRRSTSALVDGLLAAGFAVNQVVGVVRNLAGVTTESLLSALKSGGRTIGEIVSAAKICGVSSFDTLLPVLGNIGCSAAEIGKAAAAFGNVSLAALVSAMKTRNFDTQAVVDAAKHLGSVSAHNLASAMKAAGYGAADVARALKAFGTSGAQSLAVLLKGLGYDAGQVALAIKASGQASARIIAGALKQAGFSALEVGRALRQLGKHSAKAIAQMLRSVGYSVLQTAAALKNLGFNSAQIVAKALREAGYSASQVIQGLRHIGHGSVTLVVYGLKKAGFALNDILLYAVAAGYDRAQVVKRLAAEHFSAKDLVLALKSTGVSCVEAARLLSVAGTGPAAIVNAMRSAGWADPSLLAAALKQAGFGPVDVAKQLKRLGCNATRLAQLLRSAGWNDLAAIASALKSAGFNYKAVAPALRYCGADAAALVCMMKSSFSLNWQKLALALKTAGFSLSQSAPALKGAGATARQICKAFDYNNWAGWSSYASVLKGMSYGMGTVADALKYAGAGAEDVALALKSSGWTSYKEMASALKAAGFGIKATAKAIKHVGAGVTDTARALRHAGWSSYSSILSALKGAGFRGASALRSALRAIGASLSDLAGLVF